MEGASVPHAPLSCDDPSLSLALALDCSSPTPLLLLNGSCEIIAASGSFLAAFAVAPADAVGRPLFDLGDGEWDVPQLRSLMDATASGAAAIESYELDLRPRNGARVEVSETGPGTRVSIIHTGSPMTPEGDPPLLEAAI